MASFRRRPDVGAGQELEGPLAGSSVRWSRRPPEAVSAKEVVSLVDDDERGKVLDLDLPDRLHVELGVFLALVGGWTAWGGWLGTRGEVQVARAIPDEEAMGTFPFLPDDLEVTFAVPTGEESALVALVGDVPDADGLVVLYSVDDPQRARLVGESDGTGQGMLLSGILGGGGLAWVAWCLHGAAAARREILGALRDDRRTDLDYVLSADPEGNPVLLLWTPGATAPDWAVSLAEPLLGVIPVRGTVEVRGALGDDRPLAPVLPDRVLWPASRAMKA